MKTLKIYLTEYDKYDPDYNEKLLFAGPTILAMDIEEAKREIKALNEARFSSELRIANP